MRRQREVIIASSGEVLVVGMPVGVIPGTSYDFMQGYDSHHPSLACFALSAWIEYSNRISLAHGRFSNLQAVSGSVVVNEV